MAYCFTHAQPAYWMSAFDSSTFQKHQFMDLATGSLGQGLGVACGMAYTGKYFDKAR